MTSKILKLSVGSRDLSQAEKNLLLLKFIYSEKATNFLQNLHLFLTGTSASQKKVEISQNFCGLLTL